MKVKFTKLAALLLAGAALFATGCTDYEVDIQNANKRIDELTSGKVATLEQQVAALQATVATLETAADHDADIATLRSEMAAMKTALETDYQTKIANAVSDLTAKINQKLDKATYDEFKSGYDTWKAGVDSDITKIKEDIVNANTKIQALEQADEAFKTQIQQLTEQFTDQLNKLSNRVTALETLTAGEWKDKDGKDVTIKEYVDAIKQSVVDLETKLQGEIDGLDTRLQAAEKTLDELTKENGIIDQIKARIKAIEDELPTIRQNITDLQNGKLDKTEFDDYYKAAYDKFTKETIDGMQKAIEALQKLTAGTWKDKDGNDVTIQQYIDKADEILKDDYTAKYLAVVAKAFGTEAQMEAMEGNLLGRLNALEALLAGDWGDKTVKQYIDAGDQALKEYIDGEVIKLQGQIDENKRQITNLWTEVNTLKTQVNDVILPQIQFAIDYEGTALYADLGGGKPGLQGYINDMAIETFLAACQYTDQEITKLRNEMLKIFDDVYGALKGLASRIQNIVYVPDYDDLKITVNMATYTQPAAADATANEPAQTVVIDQPFTVTYEILPAKYAETVARNYKDLLSFDVKPVGTRADDVDDDDALQPAFEILEAVADENASKTGLVTFVVMPVNVASAEFAANNMPVQYNTVFELIDREVSIRIPVINRTITFTIPNLPGYNNKWVYPVVTPEDLAAYEDRAAFAASLRMKKANDVTFASDPRDLEGEVVVEDNEVASTYNVLYPDFNGLDFDIDVFKPEELDGKTELVPAMPEHQELPYSALRENPVGEKESQDPKGYRIILNKSVVGVTVTNDEGEVEGPMTLKEAADAGYFIPEITCAFKEFTYDKGTAEAVDEDNFVETEENEDGYAEIEMNPEAGILDRKAAIGNVITGTYEYTSILGTFEAYGDVTITKPLGELSATAQIVWTYANDAEVDHNIAYDVDDQDAVKKYSREGVELTIDAEKLAYLKDQLGITLSDDFRGKAPVSVVIKDKDGAEVAIATEETEGLEFPGQYPIKMDADANVTVDIANFKWDEVYTIEAKYDLDDAVITVTVVLTTVDRNREKVTLPTYEYTFVINKLDAETGYGYIEEPGYYYWNTDQDPAIADQIKAAFEKVTEAGISVTKASDFTGQEDFNTKELVNKVAPAGEPDGAGTAFGYVSISNSMESAYTQESFKPAVLAGEIFNSGKQSEDDPNLWLGNEVYRNITTYIGEVVVIPFKFNYKVPDYNFLHLSYYTFNTDTQIDGPVIPYVQKDNFADNDGTVKWWTQVLPSYFTAAAAGNNGPAGPAGPAGPGGNPAPGNDGPAGPAGPAGPGQNNNNNARVSFRHALADYDVTYINLAELAFNLVDDKDEIIEAADAEALGLEVHFDYADETQWAKDLPLVDQLLPDFVVYKNLWIDSTTFYYRTNEKKFIKALGKLTLTSGDPTPGMGGYVFPVATRFNYPKKAVKFDYVLDYSTYAMVRWTPFQEPKTNGNGITLDEHRIYRVPVLKGMELKDNRPAGVSYYVIQDGEWVKGNVAEFDAEAGTYTTGGNGYIKNVMANQAYHITTTFDYSKLDLPAELRKLLVIKYSADGVNFEDDQNDEGTLTPYFQFDYTSEVEFRGTVSIPVEVKLENPWQEDIIFKYNFIIKGATTPVAGDDNNNGGDDNANNGD